MSTFTARLDHRIPQLAAGFNELAKSSRDKVIARAVNDGVRQGKTVAQRGVAASGGFKTRYVSSKMTTRLATGSTLSGHVRGASRYSTIAEHAMTESKGNGLSASPWGVRRHYPRGFVATGKSGNRVPFQRSTVKRFPIRAIYGASVARELERDYNLRPVQERMREAAGRRFSHHVERAVAAALSKA